MRTRIIFSLSIAALVAVALSSCEPEPPKPGETQFTIESSDEVPLEEAALTAFRNYANTHPKRFGIEGDVGESLDALSALPGRFQNSGISIVHLAQTYRGLPVHGDAGRIPLVVRDGTDVVRIYGRLIDQSQTYSGFEDRMSQDAASAAIAARWIEDRRTADVSVADIQVVAVPGSAQVAYRGEIRQPVFSASHVTLATVLVNARSGELITIDHHVGNARALSPEIGDDPHGLDLVFHDDLPSVQVDNTIDFSDHPVIDCAPPGWRAVRLGDDMRYGVMDFGDGGWSSDTASFLTAARCVSGDVEEDFAGGSTGPVESLSVQLMAQDVFVKTRRAMALIDPLMGELVSHGAEHPYSWDHHPSMPQQIHRSPLISVVNASSAWQNSSPGIYYLVTVHEPDFEAMGLPVPHPLIVHCRDGGQQVDCGDAGAEGPLQYVSFIGINAPAPYQTRTLFHEMGHYYDTFNTYGLSGENFEIIPQLFSLYLHRRVYDLDYQITGNAAVNCSLSTLVGHSAGRVVHPDCIFDTDDISTMPVFDGEYTVQSFTQGYWSLLNGVSCTLNGDTLNCGEPGGLAADYPDRWMEALLFALQVGNELTFTEIWEAMALFIDANYPGDSARLQTVRSLHGLL